MTVEMFPNENFKPIKGRQGDLCKSGYQAYKIIGGYNYTKDIYGKTWNARINGEYVYKRILIQKVK